MLNMPKFLYFRWNKERLQEPTLKEAFIEHSEVVNKESEEKYDSTKNCEPNISVDLNNHDISVCKTVNESSPERKIDGLMHHIFSIQKIWPFHRYKEPSTQDREVEESSVKRIEIMNEENTVTNTVIENFDRSNDELSDENPCLKEKFYAVIYPSLLKVDTMEGFIFNDKTLALQSLKKHKDARFKVFDEEEEAKAYILQPCQNIFPSTSKCNIEPVFGICPYSAPPRSEIVGLRRDIELDRFAVFEEKIFSNPRFLITSVDTATIMMEGHHYNALHVAAKHLRPEFCKLIITTIEDKLWINKMYPDNDDDEAKIARMHHLLDSYLNMPDKKLNETPLHFACKFGCYETVKILLLQPLCDRNRKNKYGKVAKHIICDRCLSMEFNAKVILQKRIEGLFEGQYFVPVWRSENNDIQPVIGKPYSPKNPDKFYDRPSNEDYNIPCSPSLSIVAAAGPMSYSQAKEFYKQWKTPKYKLCAKKAEQPCHIRLTDTDKGLERIGRDLAHTLKTKWTEYWPNLYAWCDFSTPEGIDILETHLRMASVRLGKKTSWIEEKSKLSRRTYISHDETSCSSTMKIDEIYKKLLDDSRKKERSLNKISDIRLHDSYISETEISSKLKETSLCDKSTFSNHLSSKQHNEPKLSSDLEDTDKLKDFNNTSNDNIKSTVLEFSGSTAQISNSESDILCAETDIVNNIVMIMLKFLQLDKLSNISKMYFFFYDKILPEIMCLQNEMDLEHFEIYDFLNYIYKCTKDNFQNFQKLTLLKCFKSCVEYHAQFSHPINEETPQRSKMSSLQQNSNFSEKEIQDILSIFCELIECDIQTSKFCNNLTNEKFETHSNCSLNCSDDLNDLSSDETLFNNANMKLDFLNCDNDSDDDTELNNDKKCSSDKENCVSKEFENFDDFVTPPSSPLQEFNPSEDEESEALTPPEGEEIYIDGKANPSKIDLDIFRAIESTHIDPVFYPHVARWKHLISTKDKKLVESWPSPAVQKYRKRKSFYSMTSVLQKT